MRLRILLTLFLLTQSVLGAELVLVDDGVSAAPLIVFPDAPPMTLSAAEELADYVEKVSGARPEVIVGEPEKIPEHAIWVGFQPAVQELFPGTNFTFDRPEEILIKANENHLFIGGRDRWDPDNMNVKVIDLVVEGRQQEYGTANAIYTFIQDYLGVRWLWPGELGEDVPTQKTISFESFEFRYHPQVRARGGMFNYSQLGNRGYGRSQKWTRRQRLQLSSLSIGGGHAFGNWWERYHESHPDIFALQPDGTRSGHPNPRNAKLCQSNPAVWDLWLQGVEEQLEVDPNQTVFNGSPNDSWSSGHCVCEHCSAWDHPDGEPRLMHWYHYRETRPALSDRHVTFANHLAAKLEEKFPGKDYSVMMLCYGHSRPVPVEARPADNVIMVSVANFYGRTNLVDRGSTWGTKHRDQFAGWGKVSPHLMWRPNTGSPAGWQQGLPDLSVQQTIDDFQFIAKHGCIGLYIDAVWEHWATHGPQYYAMGQLAWDPAQEGEAILDDYYERGFGPAAANVRAYYEVFETARMNRVEQANYSLERADFPDLYSEELLTAAGEHLDRAKKRIGTTSPLYSRRIEFVAAGLRYSRLLTEVISAMEKYWEEPNEKLAQRVRENWTAMEKVAADHPYAINWGPVRPTTPRMVGLHPDHPDPKRKKKPEPRNPKDLDQN